MMTSTTSEKTTSDFALTKEHIKVLRTADSVCFDHLRSSDGGKGQIRAVKRTPQDPWRKEIEVVVPALSSVRGAEVVHYGDNANADRLSCFEMLHSTQYCEEWRTIVSLLKPGDELELEWSAGGGNNGYISRARVVEPLRKADGTEEDYSPGMNERLYHDRLFLRVRRGGEAKYYFRLKDSVCPNNTARMVRGL